MRILELIFILIITFSIDALGQVNGGSIMTVDSIIYKTSELDSLPKFNYSKGESQNEKIRAYIKDNQLWPTQDDGVFIVWVKFVIEKEGKISNIIVLKGIHPDYDKEAVKLINAMPIWKPGIKNNKFVRTEMLIPVKWTIFKD